MTKNILFYSIFICVLFFNTKNSFAENKSQSSSKQTTSKMVSNNINSEFYLDRINLKFKVGSDLYIDWKNSNRTQLPNNLTFINNLIFKNKIEIKQFIDDKLIKASEKRFNEIFKQNVTLKNKVNSLNTKDISDKNSISSKIANLYAIASIRFENNLTESEINQLIKIIREIDGIEYADLEYKNYTVEAPNDTLLPTQYYLGNVKAMEAWELADPNKIAKVAIVDTGVMTDHVDLIDNIFVNFGEMGLDDGGNDKTTNGIDDDENGFIDDFKGWDFASSDTTGQDNNPNPGNVHGTHVAGIIGAKQNNIAGIAGVAKYVSLIAVKCGIDDPGAGYISAGYQGILYAATVGAHTINCSWGGSGMGQAEAEVLKTVSDMGSIIVAAAGNNGANIAFMPASNENVLSVASSDVSDKKSGFSNFNIAVDIIAPGTQIMSTILNNDYAAFNGTSMASPVAAAALAVLKANNEELSNERLIALIRANADNIDSLNPNFAGLIGSGRVNIEKALKKDVTKFARLENYKLYFPTNSNNITGEEVIQSGDVIELDFSIKNILDDCSDVKVKIGRFNFDDNNASEIEIGNMNSGEIFTNEENSKIKYTIPNDFSLNTNLVLSIDIYDGDVKIGTSYINFLVNPVYRTMNKNNISATFNNIGHIGYNDFPQNNQGNGFQFKNYDGIFGDGILFEGALIATDTSRQALSNTARNSGQGGQDKHFISSKIFEVRKFDEEPNNTYFRGKTSFSDYIKLEGAPKDSSRTNLDIEEYIYQFTTENDSNFLILRYEITNRFDAKMDNLFFGYYFDWDIGLSGMQNICSWDYENKIGMQYSYSDTNLPKVAVAPIDQDIIDNNLINFYAIDNDGTAEDNIGVYDGFTRSEKIQVISNGIKRDTSSTTDASMAIGVGPISLEVGEKRIVHFAIAAGLKLSDLPIEIEKAKNKIKGQVLNIEENKTENTQVSNLLQVYPNPSLDGNIRLEFANEEIVNQLQSITIIYLNGNIVEEIAFGNIKNNELNLTNLANGTYLIIAKSENNQVLDFNKFVISK